MALLFSGMILVKREIEQTNIMQGGRNMKRAIELFVLFFFFCAGQQRPSVLPVIVRRGIHPDLAWPFKTRP